MAQESAAASSVVAISEKQAQRTCLGAKVGAMLIGLAQSAKGALRLVVSFVTNRWE